MKKLKLISVIILSIVFINKTSAQIKFEHGSWTEIKAKAKAEHKLIFLDAYTKWCGSCKMLVKNVFSNDTVAKFYNSTFVNASIDMETVEGKELAKQYNVIVYPTLLFIDGNGELVHRGVGAKPSVRFLQLGKDALIPEKQFGTIEKKYKNGTRDVQFIMTYLTALNAVDLDTKEPLNAYFSTQKEQDLMSRENWIMINKYVTDYKSKEFDYLLKNANAFAKKYTVDSINNKIVDVYRKACSNLIYKKVLDSVGYLQLKKEIKENIAQRSDELILWSDMTLYLHKSDYLNFANTAVTYIDKYKNKDADEMESVAYNFYLYVKDKTMLAKAETWAKKGYELDPSLQYSMDTYACMLSVNGQKQDAIKLENQAIELFKTNPAKYNQDEIPEMEEKIAEWSK
jgi:thiol-disulfide isomerase/thioredoxin